MSSFGATYTSPSCAICDDEPSTLQLLQALEELPAQRRKLYLDFEGVGLSRHGRLCLGQLAFPASPTIYLLDFVALPTIMAVSTPSGTSLRSLFESTTWRKLIYDPRSDVDALYHQFGVLPQNVLCLQLCDIALRRHRREYVQFCRGLGRVLEEHLAGQPALAALVSAPKQAGKRLFAPELGGSYQVFVSRPLSPEIVAYCKAEVQCFELLEQRLFDVLPDTWQRWVLEHSAQRLVDCVQPGFAAGSRENARAPSGQPPRC